MKKYIAYYRVSTKRQNLGIDAQKNTVINYINNNGGNIIAEYEEKESGKNNERIELHNAIAHCKREQATLIIAKLDRLSRNIGFIFALRDSGINFYCCDLPSCNTITLGIFATIAQNERETISQRTKLALAVKKASGTKLGAPNAKFTEEMRVKARKALSSKAEANTNNRRAIFLIRTLINTHNYSQIARELNSNGFLTSQGKLFDACRVKRLAVRYELINA